MNINRRATPWLIALCCSALTSSAFAQAGYTDSRGYHHVPTRTHHYTGVHPKVHAAATGAGIGAAAGAVTGLITHRGILRGAVIGAGSGAGIGLIRTSDTLYNHPILKNVATGSVAGLGLGLAGGWHHGTAARTTLIGGAAGLATGLLTHGL